MLETMSSSAEDNTQITEAAIWCDRGMALLREETANDQECEACFDRALASDPTCAEALIMKAAFLRERSQYEPAIALCDRALALGSGRLASLGRAMVASIWRNKCLSLHALGRIDEEIACYEELLLDELPVRERAEIWGLKGAAYLSAGRAAAALSSFEQAERLGHPGASAAALRCREYLAT